MYYTPPNCLKSSCVMGWTFVSMQTTPSCIWVYYLMTHLWPPSVWTRASSTSKHGELRASRLRLNPTKTQVMWLGSGQQLAKVDTDDVSTGIASPCPRCCAKFRRHLWQPAVDVSTGFSRVSYWLLPAPAAASACSMPVWGRRQNPDAGFHQYSAGLLQLAVLRHSRWFDEPPAVASERRRASHHRSQAVWAHHASEWISRYPPLSIVRWLAPLLCT